MYSIFGLHADHTRHVHDEHDGEGWLERNQWNSQWTRLNHAEFVSHYVGTRSFGVFAYAVPKENLDDPEERLKPHPTAMTRYVAIDIDWHSKDEDVFREQTRILLDEFWLSGKWFVIADRNQINGVHLIRVFSKPRSVAEVLFIMEGLMAQLDLKHPELADRAEQAGMGRGFTGIEIYPSPSQGFRIPLSVGRSLIADQVYDPVRYRGKMVPDISSFATLIEERSRERMPVDDIMNVLEEAIAIRKEVDAARAEEEHEMIGIDTDDEMPEWYENWEEDNPGDEADERGEPIPDCPNSSSVRGGLETATLSVAPTPRRSRSKSSTQKSRNGASRTRRTRPGREKKQSVPPLPLKGRMLDILIGFWSGEQVWLREFKSRVLWNTCRVFRYEVADETEATGILTQWVDNLGMDISDKEIRDNVRRAYAARANGDLKTIVERWARRGFVLSDPRTWHLAKVGRRIAFTDDEKEQIIHVLGKAMGIEDQEKLLLIATDMLFLAQLKWDMRHGMSQKYFQKFFRSHGIAAGNMNKVVRIRKTAEKIGLLRRRRGHCRGRGRMYSAGDAYQDRVPHHTPGQIYQRYRKPR